MSWFILSVIALLCWSGSDLFSKIGCQEISDKYSHLKMVIAVGVVMGIHGLFEIFVKGTMINFQIIWVYFPVSLLYIGSMTLGYLGLRYIELSVSTPICNSSGALVALLTIITGTAGRMLPIQYLAIIMTCGGAILLGAVEATEDDALRAKRQAKENRKYAKSWIALALPFAYCLLDAAGTFADSFVIDKISKLDGIIQSAAVGLTGEEAITAVQDAATGSANVAYELTFFAAAVCCFIYVKFIRKDKFVLKKETPKYVGAVCETIGQFAYIFAIADQEHLAMSAPIISSYCAASVLWSRIFLKERLSWKHYSAILIIIIGIVIMGVYDI